MQNIIQKLFKKNKSLFIDFEYTYIGGPKTFMQNLKKYLQSKNFITTQNVENSSGIFFAVQYEENVIEKVKENGGKVIQRLDGIYSPAAHGEAYQEQNSYIEKIYNKYSDFIIFQSEYSKKQCFELFGEKKDTEYSLIINGVDKEIFFPKSNSPSSLNNIDKVKFITTGNFRKIDMIEPIINAVDTLLETIDFELTIVGSVNEEFSKFVERDYISTIGNVALEEVAEELTNADIFIYSHLNPPCPNSVIEAISVGLPVVGFDSGAMSELLPFSRELLAPVGENTFHEYKQFDYKLLLEKIIYTIDNFEKYKQIALDNAYRYSFEDCGAQYIEVFNKVLNEK